MKALEHRPEIAQRPVQAPAPPSDRMLKMINPFVRLLLRSPFHGMVSETLLLLTFTGRKTGTRYTIPVAYGRQGDMVTVFTSHTWWKNVKGGAPVQVEIKRERRNGTAEAISDDAPAIAAQFLADLQAHPTLAKSYHIPLDANGHPDAEAAQQMAAHEVLVRIQLVPSSVA